AARGLRRRIQVEGFRGEVPLNPAIQAIVARIPGVNPDHVIPDTERVISELERHFPAVEPTHWEYPLPVMAKTPEVLRKAGGRVTLILRNQVQLLDIYAGDATDSLYGLTVDIGTSKLAGSLYSLNSGMCLATTGIENPQLQYGEDLMTRMSYASVSMETRKELQSKVIEGIDAIIETLTRGGIPRDRLFEVVVVGNTVMTSLFLGLDTRYLSYGPFIPPIRGPLEIQAGQLGLQLPSQTAIHVLPNIAGFVGADAVADILTTDLHRQSEPNLLIDIGTNSEVVLGSQHKISATSCAAGPAFEGAQIEHGMKAVSGAIERVVFDEASVSFQIETVDHAKPIGICGSGVVDVIAQLAAAGFLSKKGRFTSKAKDHLITEGKKRAILLHEETIGKTHTTITLSEHDVSQLLLAKAAIQTGFTLLLQHQKLQVQDIAQEYIAGAFGNYLNLANAQRIGLIPPVPLSKIIFIGNAALSGAQLALLSTQYREEARHLAKTVEFVDLARHPDFSATYTASLFL
ncbi:MAG: ASKHA domain-containing protein, partial [Candidatus Hermodarchaeota archaeon]|nr:ASKHA domain-containing protein [Candidatus Hermodarchaeota archaeon]